MRLENIMENMKSNKSNSIEFYQNGKKYMKQYDDVYSDTLKTMRYLRKKKVQKGDKVGILGKNSYEWILVDLACVASGFITVPFHNANNVLSEDNVLVKYNLKVLFIDEEYINQDNKELLINITNLLEKIKDEMAEEIEFCIPGDDNPLSIIFTSGTTALPKVIEITAKPFNHFITHASELFTFDSDDKVIIFLPMSHFGQRIYIYGAFVYKYNIVMCMPENVLKVLRVDKPTIMISVPYFYESIYRSFYDKLRKNISIYIIFLVYIQVYNFIPLFFKNKFHKLFFKEFINLWGGKMRIMVTGSAPMSEKVLKFYDISGLRLYEGYGSNEAGIITLNHPQCFKIGSVGKPFAGKEVKIDEDGQILVRSEYCWAKEYLNLSREENSEVFIEDGFIATGDTGYFDKEGFLYISGRIKEIIVLSNGKKIQPRIIEEKLKGSNLIKQCAVFGDNKPYLTAVIVVDDVNDRNSINKEIIKINKLFPSHAHIKEFIITKELFSIENKMLTNNMKLNRSFIYGRFEKDIKTLY